MTPVLAQLYALRAQVDALILMEEQAPGNVVPIMEPGSCPHCGAGPDKQQNLTSLAGPKKWWCTACRTEWPTSEP